MSGDAAAGAAPASSPERLRNGDLVRVSELGARSSKRLKDRTGQLGRIIVDDPNGNNDQHQLYTIEWVLGGRLTGVRREELLHTTAELEGMTQEGQRNRRKRGKPTDFMEEVIKNDEAKKTKRKQLQQDDEVKSSPSVVTKKTKPSPPKAVANITKAVVVPKKATKKTLKAAATKIVKKPALTKKPGLDKKPAPIKKTAPIKKEMVVKKPAPAKKKDVLNRKAPPPKKAEPAPAPEAAAVSAEQILYERHRREFERILTRLEKVDKFGYFLDDAPPEFDETNFSEAHVDEAQVAIPPPCLSSTTAGERSIDIARGDDSTSLNAQETGTATREDGAEVLTKTEDPVAATIVTSSAPERDNNVVETDAATSSAQHQSFVSSKDQTSSMGNKDVPVFPPYPPFNWKMVRRRMELDRYVLDRQIREEDERFKELGPYYRTLGKKRPRRKYTGLVAATKKKESNAVNPRVLNPKGVDWELFRNDVLGMCDAAIARDTEGSRNSITSAANKIKEALMQAYERTGRRHMQEMSVSDDRHKFWTAIEKHRNTEAAMQSWRREPFPERRYERLSKDKVCDGLSELDERIATYELKTSLPDSFVGISYRYDDTGQSEAWMKSVVDETGSSDKEHDEERNAALALAADDGVTRAQVVATMQTLLIGVQDRVMTKKNILHQPELRSANWEAKEERGVMNDDAESSVPGTLVSKSPVPEQSPEIVEQPVWGIDRYSRRNVTVCLRVEFDEQTAVTFVEKWLLPAINACPSDLAQDISNAARLLEGLPFVRSTGTEQETMDTSGEDEKLDANWGQTRLGIALRQKIQTSAPPWLVAAACQLRRAHAALGPDFFRVHPKGHGSVLLSPRVEANRLVTFYRGELYPSWRWGEKMDAIDLTQQRKNLKPALPDFYNMALERPQTDPRGYGLLFVDASRKAGHGSSLSHSCDPTCEVRVAAKNGELCLAMTTLRELEMGEELTFDYNAVTESLNEYSSAVCLCGYSRCRGSFLHFATADCYQQVLNRNNPIATRFSNLVKGTMKQVMSEDDERVLRNHGFQTAAFGAISVNRREGSMHGEDHCLIDSLDIVPVWLRTYVADALRYIEYERRALPISLICEHLSTVKRKKAEIPSSKPSKQPGREPSFFYFSRVESDFLHGLLRKERFPESVNGLELKHALQKVASTHWQSLSEDKKKYWKDRADADYEKKRKAWLVEQKRPKQASTRKGKKGNPDTLKPEISDVLLSSKLSFEDADAEGVSAMEQRIQQLTQTLSRVGRVLDRHRERELESNSEAFETTESTTHRLQALRKLAHSPLCVLSDEKVVGWMWNGFDGIVSTLLRNIARAPCARPSLLQKLSDIKKKYPLLEKFADPTIKPKADACAPSNACAPPSGAEGRHQLKSALLDMRKMILGELRDMARDFRRFRAESKTKPEESAEGDIPNDNGDFAKDVDVLETEKDEPDPNDEEHADSLSEGAEDKDASHTSNDTPNLGEEGCPGILFEDGPDTRGTIRSVVDDLVDQVVKRIAEGETALPGIQSSDVIQLVPEKKKMPLTLESDPWLEFYSQRFTLQVSADVLLLYAHTNNFFTMNPYHVLESTPVDVYARELGNSVPRSVIDETVAAGVLPNSDFPSDQVAVGADQDLLTKDAENPIAPVTSVEPVKCSDTTAGICQPDDIVARVSVRYQSDYVLSQLLQWYNGGIGQKPGLPDLLGCAILPSMQGCWSSSLLETTKLKPERKTAYELKIRRLMIEWLQDPYQRGNPWPEDIRCAFEQKEEDIVGLEGACSRFIAFGSPIIDFLVTGNEASIHRVLDELDADDKVTSKKKSDGLLSSLDKGRPAQAVSTWVQCENPECLKWRKIPWHVDVDLLPDKFYCKDNVWNPCSNSCDAPEDDWDHDDSLVDKNGKVESSPVRKKRTGSLSPLDEKNFVEGARFDVRRQKKDTYCTGVVLKVDFSGKVKRILFHFLKTHSKFDEWIEFGSDRIARLDTKASPPEPKGSPTEPKGTKQKNTAEPKGAKKTNPVETKGTKKNDPESNGTKKKSPAEPKGAKRKTEPGTKKKNPGEPKATGKNGIIEILSKTKSKKRLTEKGAQASNSAKTKKQRKNTDGKDCKAPLRSQKNESPITAMKNDIQHEISIGGNQGYGVPENSATCLEQAMQDEPTGSFHQSNDCNLLYSQQSTRCHDMSAAAGPFRASHPSSEVVDGFCADMTNRTTHGACREEMINRSTGGSHVFDFRTPLQTGNGLDDPSNRQFTENGFGNGFDYPSNRQVVGHGFGDQSNSQNRCSDPMNRQFFENGFGDPSNHLVFRNGFGGPSNNQVIENGFNVSSHLQYTGNRFGFTSNFQYTGNGFGVSPYHHQYSDNGRSAPSYRNQVTENGPDASSNSSMMSSFQNSGIPRHQKHGRTGLTPTTSIDSAAYDLLLLSLPRNNTPSSPYAPPSSTSCADSHVTNSIPSAAGLPALTSGQPNGAGGFPPVSFTQTSQQAIYRRNNGLFTNNPFNMG